MSMGIATPAGARTTPPSPGECRAAAGGTHSEGTTAAACPNDASPLATPPVTAAPAPSAPSGAQKQSEVAGHPAQAATGVPQGRLCGPPYIDGDARLGPRFLPHAGLLGRILRGYVPLGGLPGPRFIYRYRQDDNTWRYPPDLGFAHGGYYPNGRPLRFRVTLGVGRLIDRFGGPTGDFVSPFGASYVSRALPPDNLNTFSGDPAHPCNYHVYRVIRSFDVDAGPAARAFQQYGGGLQYFFVAAYVGAPPDKDGGTNINFLIGAHYLEPAN